MSCNDHLEDLVEIRRPECEGDRRQTTSTRHRCSPRIVRDAVEFIQSFLRRVKESMNVFTMNRRSTMEVEQRARSIRECIVTKQRESESEYLGTTEP